MSAKIMGAIFEADLPHQQAWVLLAYADHADHDGGGIFASLDLIAWKTGYSRRSVSAIAADLVRAGYMAVERQGGGRGNPTTYRINVDALPKKPPRSINHAKTALFSETMQSDAETMQNAPETMQSDAETMQNNDGFAREPLTVKPLTKDDIEIWNRVQELLRLQLPRSSYATWVAPVRLQALDAERITLRAPSPAVRDFLTVRLERKLAASLADVAGRPLAIAIEVA